MSEQTLDALFPRIVLQTLPFYNKSIIVKDVDSEYTFKTRKWCINESIDEFAFILVLNIPDMAAFF